MPPRKGLGRGCIIVAGIVGGILLVCGGGFGIVAISCWQDPDVRRAARAVGEGFSVMQEAMTAPGTEELRQAGCQSALVLTPEQLGRIARAAQPDAGGRGRPLELPQHRSVVCQVRKPSIACDEVARVYSGAIEAPPAELAVTVQQSSSGQSMCDGIYAPDGRRLGELGVREARTVGRVGRGR